MHASQLTLPIPTFCGWLNPPMYEFALVVIYTQQVVVGRSGVFLFQVPEDICFEDQATPSGIGPMNKDEGLSAACI